MRAAGGFDNPRPRTADRIWRKRIRRSVSRYGRAYRRPRSKVSARSRLSGRTLARVRRAVVRARVRLRIYAAFAMSGAARATGSRSIKLELAFGSRRNAAARADRRPACLLPAWCCWRISRSCRYVISTRKLRSRCTVSSPAITRRVSASRYNGDLHSGR
jgi:hypothetical protein